MEKIRNILEELKQINLFYELEVAQIVALEEEIKNAKVCTPIIGKFSSGKSALINTLLGQKRGILKVDITPETAIPAEITYSEIEDTFRIVNNDGSVQNVNAEEYRKCEVDAETTQCSSISLVNNFLSEIPDVMLVDMPGFESGFEIHNVAIDKYIHKSFAYIIAFQADDMIVRRSVGDILKELCLYDMPLCVVITKMDYKKPDFDESFSHLQESLAKYIGNREVTYCKTSSKLGDAEELEDFLRVIQARSQQILAIKYGAETNKILINTEQYLKEMLTNSQMTESELSEKEAKLQRQFSTLNEKFIDEQGDFAHVVEECKEDIKNDVQRAMESELSTLVTMTMNNQDINSYLNTVVRNTVTVSVKKNFIPKVEKYLKRVEKCINGEAIGDVNVTFSFNASKVDDGVTSSVVAIAASFLLGVPILGIIAAVWMKISGDKKRQEAKQNIRRKLQCEVFPQVLDSVGRGIDKAILEQVTLVNTSVEGELANQKEILEKAIEDVRGRLQDETAKKENLEAQIQVDMERMSELRDELR